MAGVGANEPAYRNNNCGGATSFAPLENPLFDCFPEILRTVAVIAAALAQLVLIWRRYIAPIAAG
jgi:hypothetical protein